MKHENKKLDTVFDGLRLSVAARRKLKNIRMKESGEITFKQVCGKCAKDDLANYFGKDLGLNPSEALVKSKKHDLKVPDSEDSHKKSIITSSDIRYKMNNNSPGLKKLDSEILVPNRSSTSAPQLSKKVSLRPLGDPSTPKERRKTLNMKTHNEIPKLDLDQPSTFSKKSSKKVTRESQENSRRNSV